MMNTTDEVIKAGTECLPFTSGALVFAIVIGALITTLGLCLCCCVSMERVIESHDMTTRVFNIALTTQERQQQESQLTTVSHVEKQRSVYILAFNVFCRGIVFIVVAQCAREFVDVYARC